MTRQLSLLEQNGYVIRQTSKTDKRITEVYPTQKAIDILPVVFSVLGEWNDYITEDFTTEEKHYLLTLLERVAGKSKAYAENLRKRIKNEKIVYIHQTILFANLLAVFIKFTGTIMDLLIPWLLSYIIDYVVPQGNIKRVYMYGGLMIACAVVAIIFNIIANRMSISTSRKITKRLRHDLFEKYLCFRADKQMILLAILNIQVNPDTYYIHQMVDRMQRALVFVPRYFAWWHSCYTYA